MGDANKLFVGNLSYDAQTEDLRCEFEKYGNVQDCIVMTDRDTGRPRGFGFVTFSSEKEASTAQDAMNGQEFMGRQLNVNAATSRRGGGGGGGGYRGGGGYGGGGGYQGGGGGYGGGSGYGGGGGGRY